MYVRNVWLLWQVTLLLDQVQEVSLCVLVVLQFVCETAPFFLLFNDRASCHCLIMILMSLDVQRLYVAYFCVKLFLGSDDEDARRSGVGRRELSQVRLKEVIHNYDLL